MKKQNPLITDEHIVAYLDRELEAGEEFRSELSANPELAAATKEYAVLKKIFAASRADSRFSLSAMVDEKTRTVLAEFISGYRKTVRIAAATPNALPARSISALRSIKYLWAKRVGMGFALAGLAISLWFNFTTKNEQITQVPVPQNNRVLIPTEVAPPTPLLTQVPQPQQSAKTNTGFAPVAKTMHRMNAPEKNIAANTISQTEAPPSQIQQSAKEDPADIMISRRYAKLIKATPAVEVTEQDRLANDQM